jgi:hypothetical protein
MVHGLRKLADKAHLFAKGGTQTSHRRLPGIKNCYEWCSVGPLNTWKLYGFKTQPIRMRSW